MLTRRLLAVIAAVGVGLVLVSAAVPAAKNVQAVPGAVLDQSNPYRTPACRPNGWAPDTPSDWAAQTFTAGVSGKLTDVALLLRGPNPQFSVAITSVDAAGQPVIASPLATAGGTQSSVTRFAWVSVNFATPARVEAGKQYAIVLSSPTENFPAGVWVAWAADLGASYRDSRGVACATGAYTAGRALGMGVDTPRPDADFFFGVYVVPFRHLVVQKSGAGTVHDSSGALNCGATCAADFDNGQRVILTAVSTPTTVFAGWTGPCASKNPICSVLMTADVTATAKFEPRKWPLTVRVTGSGTVRSKPVGLFCGQTHRRCLANFGTAVRLTAKPARNATFLSWGGVCKARGKQPTCPVKLNKRASVIARFSSP